MLNFENLNNLTEVFKFWAPHPVSRERLMFRGFWGKRTQLLSVILCQKSPSVGVTFPPELLREFDEIKSKMGYESRSKAIQDAVRLDVSERKWLKEEGNQTGVLLMVHAHEVNGLESYLTE